MLVIGIGALLVVGGVVYLAAQAIWRGRLSGPAASAAPGNTLEPPRRGLGFLGVGPNWPGFLMIALGAIFLLIGGYF